MVAGRPLQNTKPVKPPSTRASWRTDNPMEIPLRLSQMIPDAIPSMCQLKISILLREACQVRTNLIPVQVNIERRNCGAMLRMKWTRMKHRNWLVNPMTMKKHCQFNIPNIRRRKNSSRHQVMKFIPNFSNWVVNLLQSWRTLARHS